MRSRVPLEDIADAYRETGSVWKTGKRLGLCGQSVHQRLRAAGVAPVSGQRWDQDEIDELKRMVGECTLGEIGARLNRTYAAVACKINDLGIGTRFGTAPRKIPRGAGYDKASIKRHIKALDAQPDTPITRYARANNVGIEMLVRSIEKHFPEWWLAYRESHSDMPQRICAYCEQTFVPSLAKQRYCTRICAARRRSDLSYFGGQRRHTIGLAEGRCQICGKTPDRGLSSHHVLGKENDPGNTLLIALCTGCHQLVTLLGSRDWNETNWESLITFAWMRKRGPQIATDRAMRSLHVTVDIDTWEMDKDEIAEMDAPA